jgi:hypothetical protein
MTKRSSFVIPAALPDVAVIVDISIAPQIIIDAESARTPNLAGLSCGLRF